MSMKESGSPLCAFKKQTRHMQYSVTSMQMKGPFEFRDGQKELGRGLRLKKKKKKNVCIRSFCFTYGSMFARTLLRGLAAIYTFGVTLFNKKTTN